MRQRGWYRPSVGVPRDVGCRALGLARVSVRGERTFSSKEVALPDAHMGTETTVCACLPADGWRIFSL